MTTAHDLCEFLQWDSDFFGRRIGRVVPHSLTPETVSSVANWCLAQKIQCLYLLCDAGDADTVRLAEDAGFRFVDIRVTFARNVDTDESDQGTTGGEVVRLCVPSDIPALRSMAAAVHHDSRFYKDANFPRQLCDALYATWIDKSCRGYADAVLVAEVCGRPAGYVSCHIREGCEGQIGLIGVGPGWQGKGLGPTLVRASLNWFAGRKAPGVTVVTQGQNIAAQRLYGRCGFLVRSVQLWYHNWFSAPAT